MGGFPKTIHFIGLNKPIRAEHAVRDLEVIGEIPREIDGAFFRAVPDPAHPPMFDDDILLSADGMVSRFQIRDGHVDHDIRYVETARYKAERAARVALFGKYRNPFTNHPSVEGVESTVANTTPVWHGGRLLMTKEDGHAYEVDPATLATIGGWTFGGRLRSQTMTAHPRIDPATGEMFFFGYEADGSCTTDIAYCIADKSGALVSEQWFKAPYCANLHDFAITENYAVFPIYPTTADLERLKAGGAHWAHQQDLESWVAIMPRYGKVDEIRWFKGPKGVSAFHLVNAFEEGGLVHLDHCLSDTCAFAFMREAGGIHRAPQDVKGALTRWTFDMSGPDGGFTERPLGPPGDLPRLRDADRGRAYQSAWYLTMNPQGGPPIPGGPVGAMFNALVEVFPATGRIVALGLPPGTGISEPVHIPSQKPDRAGWLLAVVDTQLSEDDYRSELWVIDANDISRGAIARALLPVRARPQVHGVWIPSAELRKAGANSGDQVSA